MSERTPVITAHGDRADLTCACGVRIMGLPVAGAGQWRDRHRCSDIPRSNHGGMYGEWGMYGMPHGPKGGT